ncbi:(deoxy)nucleoside triphosphate pyrophosphohydrolase [Rothia amarae]|uniref:8-oxo-dGTP diphosphatase n=1 Tax=Rothia amarae TaxID=169480 RepID=A0A7H2BK45_9MICC|nr:MULTISPECIES: (deoxy)nucleoside triphosphate pyrophosphohydrolase [Rothia]QNV40041.1 (deoxy)nucleoside triphosphate pyrophosphohydrolase [Rothia amarae]
MKKRIDVVGAVLLQNGKVLCAQRGKSMTLPLLWEFPGGKIEPGETPQEALKRELEEELLIGAEIGDQVESTTFEYDFGIVTLTTFYCALTTGEPTLTEHAQIRWLTPDKLSQLEWAPADIPAFKKIQKELS